MSSKHIVEQSPCVYKGCSSVHYSHLRFRLDRPQTALLWLLYLTNRIRKPFKIQEFLQPYPCLDRFPLGSSQVATLQTVAPQAQAQVAETAMLAVTRVSKLAYEIFTPFCLLSLELFYSCHFAGALAFLCPFSSAVHSCYVFCSIRFLASCLILIPCFFLIPCFSTYYCVFSYFCVWYLRILVL